MERSGNFYKAIRLGYILISILIGCMVKMFGQGNIRRWREKGLVEPVSKRPGKIEYRVSDLRILQQRKQECQNSMVNVLDKDKILWYVMRAYKNENTAEDRLSNETYGLEYFIPKQKVLRTVKGKKVFFKEIYIETERIIIRNFKQKDAEGLLEYLSHPRVNCFAGDRLCSREAAWAYMQYSPKDMLRYAVSLKKDDFIIGDVFALRENEDTYNVGWHFNKRFEGKGFACEAAAGLLDYLFREAGARRIYGFVEDDNIRSKRLCERLGMRREGCFKEFVTFVNNPDGSPKYEDTCVYAILEKEWNTIRQW